MLTWTKENGTWGLKNFDIRKLPGEVYGAVCKLHDYEKSGLTPDMAERAKEILDFFGSEDAVIFGKAQNYWTGSCTTKFSLKF